MKTERASRNARVRILAAIGLAVLGLGAASGRVQAQANPPAGGEVPANPPAREGEVPARNLTARYRFRQIFGPQAPAIGQYEVAYRESLTFIAERAQGAPHQETFQRVARYTDRPVEVGPIDDRMVASVVRRYGQAGVKPDPYPRTGVRPLLSGVELWIKPQPGGAPEILVMNPPKLFREEEFQFVADSPFYPNFSMVVPADLAVGLDSTWTVSGLAVEALVRMPSQGGQVSATLKDVRPASPGAKEQVAVISVAGRVLTDEGDTALNAEIEFTFTPQDLPGENVPADVPIDAVGGVSKVRLAQSSRLAPKTINRSLVLQCRWPGGEANLEVPAAPPEPTRENSWLTWVDPKGRFYFSYPQIYGFKWDGKNPSVFYLAQAPVGQADLVSFKFKPDETVRPDDVFQEATASLKAELFTAVRTSPAPDRLDTSDWNTGAEVQHMEAKLTDPTGRQLVREIYVLQFPKNDTLIVGATTPTSEVQAFRSRVEEVLKTFHLGTPQEGAGK